MKLLITFRCFGRFHKSSRVLGLVLLLSSMNVFAQQTDANAHVSDPENLVRHLYDQVTFPAGETPDWDYVRTLFIEASTVHMRVSKSETAQLSLEGWVQDFENFIQTANIETTGFEEKIVTMKTMVFGDIAHILVLYTSYIPGKSKAPREGVDSFHLIRKEGRWWIVSILNEIPTQDRPKPQVLH
ncbi:hypothetical protein WIW50_07595 [Flavobacteriaceae bacterium 3-367]